MLHRFAQFKKKDCFDGKVRSGSLASPHAYDGQTAGKVWMSEDHYADQSALDLGCSSARMAWASALPAKLAR